MAAGSDTARIYSYRYFSLSESDRDAAWDLIENSIKYAEHRYHGWDETESFVRADLDRVKRKTIHGTPSECIDQLRAYRDALDPEFIPILMVNLPGLSRREKREMIHLAGEQILPAFA